MRVSELDLSGMDQVLGFYIDYYNSREGACWTRETAGRRIRQVLTMEGAYSLLLREDDGTAVGFAMGYFKQYDDLLGYTLEEIVIAGPCQHRGLGTLLLEELETRVRARGAACVELQAVSDEMHEHYYGKAGYRDAQNFVMKVKWLR